MKCSQAKRYLTALSLGELSQEDARAVREHLENCADCAADLREMEAGVALLQRLETEPAPVGLSERILAHLPLRREGKIWRPGWKLAWGGGIAALAVIVLVSGILVSQWGLGKQVAQAPSKEMARMAEEKAPGAGAEYSSRGGEPVLPSRAAEGGLGPFGPPGSRVQAAQAPQEGQAGERVLAKIGAPAPAREEKKEPLRLALLPRGSNLSFGNERPPGATPGPAAPVRAQPATAPMTRSESRTALPGISGGTAASPAAPAADAGRPVPTEAALAVAPAAAEEEKRFNLDLEGADLAAALRLLGSVQRKSVVVAPDVKGTVTMRLRNATADEALEKLQKQFDLSVERTPDTLVVRRAEETSGMPDAPGLI